MRTMVKGREREPQSKSKAIKDKKMPDDISVVL